MNNLMDFFQAKVVHIYIPSVVLLWTIISLSKCIYRIFFHPLCQFPGSRWHAATHFPYLYHAHLSGTWVKRMKRLHEKYGPIVRIGPDHLALDGSIAWPDVFARQSGDVKDLAKKPNFIFPGDDASIIGASGEPHRRMRRVLGPVFNVTALSSQEIVVTSHIDKLVKVLTDHAYREQPVDMVNCLGLVTFDIVGSLGFSRQSSSLQAGSFPESTSSAGLGVQSTALLRFISALPLIHVFVDFFKHYSTDRTSDVGMMGALNDAIESEKTQIDHDRPSGNFLTYLLKRKSGDEANLSRAEVQATAITMVLAGTETMTTALTGFCFNLASNSRAYTRLVHEVRTALATEDSITADSVSKLDYLGACINESLRVYPTAPEMPPRICPGEEIGGIFVPIGTLLSTYQYATFRNPDHFASPEEFHPERWLEESHQYFDSTFSKDYRSVFRPFSFGARDCIGKNLADMEMRLLLTRLLFKFDISLIPGQQEWRHTQRAFLIWEKTPLWIKLQQRQSS